MSENKNEPSENLCKLRKMSARLSFLSQTDGSCALEQGNTVIWCTVNGPGDATSTKRDNERLIINVAHNDIDSTQNTTKIARMVRSALVATIDCIRYPRATLDVAIKQIQRGGSEPSASLNATCLACLDNGIVMKGIFCGITIASFEEKVIVDPDTATSSSADALFHFAVMAKENDEELCIVASDTDGCFKYQTFEAARKLALVACKDIFMFFRQVVQRKMEASK